MIELEIYCAGCDSKLTAEMYVPKEILVDPCEKCLIEAAEENSRE